MSFLLAISSSNASSLSTTEDERIGCLLGPAFEPQLLKEPFSEVPEALVGATGRQATGVAGIALGESGSSTWYLLSDRLDGQYLIGEFARPGERSYWGDSHCLLAATGE